MAEDRNRRRFTDPRATAEAAFRAATTPKPAAPPPRRRSHGPPRRPGHAGDRQPAPRQRGARPFPEGRAGLAGPHQRGAQGTGANDRGLIHRQSATPIAPQAGFRPLPQDPVHGAIEGRQEGRAVGTGERLRPARDRPSLSQGLHQVPGGERQADRCLAERLAGEGQDRRAGLHAAGGQGHVGGEHDAPGSGPRRDPVVCGIEFRADHDALDPGFARQVQHAVGDDVDG